MLDPSKTSDSWTLVCMEDFFREDILLVSKVIAAARSAGCASSELTCKLINPGSGDGGSSMMVACASWLVLVVAVAVSTGWVVVFLGGMMGSEKVSNRQVEVSVQMYCQELEYSRSDDRVTKSNGSVVGGNWLQLMCCALPKCLCP